ncbi:PREDICTED: reverse mRNAase [Prunus dulcis]|uniref:PREDICTED: reverse mRNAase n=1 Tax=Prunus dulcis TaxID=3755 RepID=A0A5E4FW26_PRUDU|nr:PREDICTED: reverse mRNAase [Prunus dulcis]
MTGETGLLEKIIGNILSIVTEEMNRDLLVPITEEVVKAAAVQLGTWKAPGPDGFPSYLYQKYWKIMSNIVSGTATDFHNGLCSLKEINKTFIALIPKVQSPDNMGQFRPISLCNSSYKILSKVIANRLKKILPEIISDSQNAFVPERQIQDNVILTHEAFHYLKMKKKGRCFETGIKVDMNKAYDRIEWDFMEVLMRRMGFNSRWINLVLGCVRSVSFSIILNGKPGDFFCPFRGLRQGDPLSLYLFLLVSEALSLNLSKLTRDGNIQGIKLARRSPTLSHLFFADDSLFFLKADVLNCQRFMQVLDKYCLASGQCVNFEKSNMVFSPNTPSSLRVQLCEMFGFNGVDNAGTYLGLPTIWGRLKRAALAYIKDRVRRKIKGWKQSSLSLAGKEILLKAVATAIPAYPMSYFKFPASVCSDINGEMARFWWKNGEEGSKIHWKAWESLCKSKDEGGLGFRHFSSFNIALLATTKLENPLKSKCKLGENFESSLLPGL